MPNSTAQILEPPYPIDLVYTWVDGSDPVWQAKRKRISDNDGSRADDNGAARYTDNDELRYSLRSVDMYAPWIRKIFIVTDSQVPKWLDTTNPKIEIVDHRDILPPEALPCFNSQVIEHCLHRIPGLAEHFIYSNDDMLLNKPVTPADFFAADDLPIVRLTRGFSREFSQAFKTIILKHKLTSYSLAIRNAARLVRARYGKYYNGDLHHNMDSYLKSTYADVRQTFDDAIAPTMVNHLRAANDIQRCIYSFAPLATGRAHLHYAGRDESFRLRIQHPHKYAQMERYNPTFFCINDSEHCTDEHRRRAHEFMEQRFSTKSQFEK